MAEHPYTTKISYSAAGSVYTDLTELVSITPPKPSKGSMKTTDLASSNKTNTSKPSWRTTGDCVAKFYFSKSQYNTLMGFYQSETVYYWKITHPLLSGESVASNTIFNGWVKEIGEVEKSVDSDDAEMYEVTIEATGAITFNSGS